MTFWSEDGPRGNWWRAQIGKDLSSDIKMNKQNEASKHEQQNMTLKHRSMFFLGQIKYHGITAFDCVLTERQLTVIFLSTPENEWMIHIRIMFGW